MDRIFIIDVMPLLYRGHFAFLSKPRMTTTGVNTSALFSYTATVMQILEQRAPTHIALVFDSRTPTFRHEAFPQYKAQREKLPEDLQAAIGMAQEFADAMRLPALCVDGFEADDLMGTVSRLAAESGMEAYLVTPDKDIAQLVGPGVFLYRLSGKNPEIWGEAEVCEHWKLKTTGQMVDYLALAGDASDNIPGVKGVGEKTAQKLLADFGGIEDILAAAADGKIAGKLGEKIAAAAADARLSRFLTEIRRDVALPCGLDGLKVREPDKKVMAAFCAKYELSSVARRLGIDIQSAAATADLPLFGAAQAESAAAPSGEEASAASLATTPHDYTLVADEAALFAMVGEIKSAGRFAFDTEATSADARLARLVGLSFATAPGRAWYVPYPPEPAATQPVAVDLFGVPLEPPASPAEPVGASAALPAETLVRMLAPLFASPSLVKTGHNTKYDRELLSRFGMPVAAPCHDTMLMHFALDAADRHGLDRLARIYLGYDTIPISTLIGEGRAADPAKMAELPPAAILDYAAEDADVALRLYDALLPEVEAAGLSRALEISEEPLVDVLLGMEEAGVRIDAVTLRDFGRELETEIAALEARIYEAAGGHFNLSSPRQLGDVLFGKLAIDEKAAHTATGQYVTSEDVLQKYAAKHPIVADILDWRAAEKLKSTYADKLPGCISAADGRVHTHFSQAFTETGRLASSDPNLQNIPVRTERGKRIRAAVVARDDNHVLVSADYSQIELRIMAALSGDEAMLEAFRSGRDIHTETASRVFKVAPGAVTPEQRSRCKMVNFGIIYGISVFGLGQRLGISRTEAGAFIDEYFIQYPGVRSFMEKAVADAREKGYAETVLGRRRSLRDISSRNGTVRQAAERNAINTPVQGSAADLIKMAMVRVDRALRAEGLRARLVLQIHDELLLDVPKDEEPRVREIVREAMLGAWDFGVPLEVEIGSGSTWLDAH